ncbi:hypothetical protein [Enterobacter cancerogenus]|nr:hypothetical protein [Enterobacter cancerogenus]
MARNEIYLVTGLLPCLLTLRGYLGIPDMDRIDADWQRLNAYIENEGKVL